MSQVLSSSSPSTPMDIQFHAAPRWVCTPATLYAWSVSAQWRERALRAGSDPAWRHEMKLAAVRMYAADQARWNASARR